MRKCKACERDKAPPRDRVVCERVFGKKVVQWWEREPGWVEDEVRRALRRPPLPKPPKKFTLPRPTLEAEAKRLADAVIEADGVKYEGRDAAERWVADRRRQLGLD